MNLLFRLLPAGMSRDGFTCGNKALDAYWRTQAGQDQKRGFATVVIASDTQTPEKIALFADSYYLSSSGFDCEGNSLWKKS